MPFWACGTGKQRLGPATSEPSQFDGQRALGLPHTQRRLAPPADLPVVHQQPDPERAVQVRCVCSSAAAASYPLSDGIKVLAERMEKIRHFKSRNAAKVKLQLFFLPLAFIFTFSSRFGFFCILSPFEFCWEIMPTQKKIEF